MLNNGDIEAVDYYDYDAESGDVIDAVDEMVLPTTTAMTTMTGLPLPALS